MSISVAILKGDHVPASLISLISSPETLAVIGHSSEAITLTALVSEVDHEVFRKNNTTS